MNSEVQHYLRINHFKLSTEVNWENFRFACIDSESTGLNPRKDRIVSIAGVGVSKGEICLWDQFSVMLQIAHNTSSVTIHGITREESAAGLEEHEALRLFLDWLADGVIVGHHIQHDLDLLNTALQRHFSMQLKNVVIDTMEAFRTISDSGGFLQRPPPQGHSLDALCDCFHIIPHDRHTALGDAYLTAQILFRIIKEARNRGLWNLKDLHAWYADEAFPFGDGK